MKYIKKIILHNFKRFQDIELDLDPELNIFIGDNESGKSSILQAIELVARGSRHKVEEIGLERLFNVDIIKSFMQGSKSLTDLPVMYVELYFGGVNSLELEGTNNSKKDHSANGIKMVCKVNDNYSSHVNAILNTPNAIFPYEFFSIEFSTFAGQPYNGYTKKLNTIFIDNSQIGNPNAMREYVQKIYTGKVDELNRIKNRHEYHKNKVDFQTKILDNLSASITPYKFSIKESSTDNIETDISLLDGDIPIENKGTGIQCFIKTELSLNSSVSDIDAVLLEEPENHLCYTKMLGLIDLIKSSSNRQLFISTHSDLISTRLNLQKCILLNSSSINVASLGSLTEETAKFFMKAPDNNMLQFVLAKKVILVEGDAEYILMEALYKNTLGKELIPSEIAVIAVDGKCFKRYLEIARLLNIKVAVITDNDKDYQKNIDSCYTNFKSISNIRIFSDNDNGRYTFEVCLYQDNAALIDTVFANLRTNTPLEFMLSKKAEAAFRLFTNCADNLAVPNYIKEAIRWVEN